MKHKLAFDRQDRGYRIRAWYRDTAEGKTDGDALVEITNKGKLLRHFLYAAYKIWNLAAHFSDIVDSEMEHNIDAYAVVGSEGLGSCVVPKPTGAAAERRRNK